MTIDLDIPGSKSQPKRTLANQPPAPSNPVQVTQWPVKRRPEGIGISVRDGWNFGIGLGFALIIAIPVIMTAVLIIMAIGLTIVGGSLATLF